MFAMLKKAVRPWLPNKVLAAVRKLRGQSVVLAPRKRISLCYENGNLTLNACCAREGWQVRSLVLSSRVSGCSLSLPVVVNEFGFTTCINLAECVFDLGLETGIIDLYLEYIRPCKDLPSDAPLDLDSDLEVNYQRLGRFTETIREHDGETFMEVGGVEVSVDITSVGNISLVVGDTSRLRALTIKTRRLEQHRREVSFKLDAKLPSAHLVSATLVVVGRQTQARVDLPVDLSLDERGTRLNNGVFAHTLSTSLDFTKVAERVPGNEDTIDLLVEAKDAKGRTHLQRIHGRPSENPRQALLARTVENNGINYHYVPYRTFRAHNLSYRVDTFTTEAFRYMCNVRKIAWLAPLLKPFLGIWLVGEVPYKAQDNGYRFFKYLRENHPERRAYYVINESSPDRSKVEALGNVVFQHSKKHILISVLASRFVGSHHAEYLLPTRDIKLQRWTRGVRVFLQHGPTAQKNVTQNYGRQTSLEKPTERFMVTSELEKKIIVEDYGYRSHQVPVVGFARFDQLFEQDVEKKPIVLIMPTWRDYLMQEGSFLQSDYYFSWRGLLIDERFRSALTKAGLELMFVLHSNMRKYADHFDVEGVTLIRQEDADIQLLMKQSSVLITDFSSVAWDFTYLDRPVLYFQFDHASLKGNRQPHIDFETSLPGPIAHSIDEAVSCMQQIIDNKLKITFEYQNRSRAFLKYKDQQNCDRIYEVVRKAWSPLTAFERIRNSEISQKAWRVFRRNRVYVLVMQAMAWFGGCLPRKDIVIFESDRGTSYGDAPRYIYERLIQRDHGLKIVWANNTTIRFKDESTEKVQRFSPRYWWLASRARYWISNQNMPNDMRKPSATRFLQTWHGTPLKRMQHDVPDMGGRDETYQKRAARLTSYWDTLLSASPYATKAFRSAFQYEGEVLEVGYPRNDLFSWPDRQQRMYEAKARLGISSDERKIILYAPTFRDDNRKGRWWKHNLELDLDTFVHDLGNDYILLTRFHPLVRNPLPREHANSKNVLDVSRYPDIQELLLMSDLLVTDYSSLFFDFANLRRPMVFFAYDLEEYRDNLRGFYLDYESEVPGPIAYNTVDLIQFVRELELPDETYLSRLDAFRNKYSPFDDGGASDRVIDHFFGGGARKKHAKL